MSEDKEADEMEADEMQATMLSMRADAAWWLELIDDAAHIYDVLPLKVRDGIDSKVGEVHDVDLTMALAQVRPDARSRLRSIASIRKMQIDELLKDGGDGLMEGEAVEIIMGLVRALPRLRSKSRRDLRRFFEAVKGGDSAYLVAKAQSSDLEVMMSRVYPDDVSKLGFKQ